MKKDSSIEHRPALGTSGRRRIRCRGLCDSDGRAQWDAVHRGHHHLLNGHRRLRRRGRHSWRHGRPFVARGRLVFTHGIGGFGSRKDLLFLQPAPYRRLQGHSADHRHSPVQPALCCGLPGRAPFLAHRPRTAVRHLGRRRCCEGPVGNSNEPEGSAARFDAGPLFGGDARLQPPGDAVPAGSHPRKHCDLPGLLALPVGGSASHPKKGALGRRAGGG